VPVTIALTRTPTLTFWFFATSARLLPPCSAVRSWTVVKPRAFAAASRVWVIPIPPKRAPGPRTPRLGSLLLRVLATLSACDCVRVPSLTSPLRALLMPASLLVTTLVEVVAEAGVMATAPTAPVARTPDRMRTDVRLRMEFSSSSESWVSILHCAHGRTLCGTLCGPCLCDREEPQNGALELARGWGWGCI